MEKLKYLLTNPYSWLLFAFILSLPYVLTYMRRFYPKELQKQMEKEEACTLKRNEKPEMKTMLKNVRLGSLFAFLISLIIAYFAENSLEVFKTLFMIIMMPIVIYAMVMDYKINKNKNCNHVSVKYMLVMFAIIVLIAFIVILIFAPSR